jgi:Phage Mu protein F like protein
MADLWYPLGPPEWTAPDPLSTFAADSWMPARLRAFTALVQAEGSIYRAVVELLNQWATRLREAVFGSQRPTPGVRPDSHGVPFTNAWFSTSVDNVVDIEIREIFLDSADFEDDGEPDANYRVTSYLSQARNRLVAIPDRVYSDVRTATMKATSEGWSIDRLEERIGGILAESGSEMWRNRARVIARTEAIGAFNAGRHAGFLSYAAQVGGRWDKVWLATHDHRTRPTHARETGADGQRVPLTVPFTVGGAAMMYPGDPTGPPQEVIQCRCSILLAREGEQPDLSNRHFRRPA